MNTLCIVRCLPNNAASNHTTTIVVATSLSEDARYPAPNERVGDTASQDVARESSRRRAINCLKKSAKAAKSTTKKKNSASPKAVGGQGFENKKKVAAALLEGGVVQGN